MRSSWRMHAGRHRCQAAWHVVPPQRPALAPPLARPPAAPSWMPGNPAWGCSGRCAPAGRRQNAGPAVRRQAGGRGVGCGETGMWSAAARRGCLLRRGGREKPPPPPPSATTVTPYLTLHRRRRRRRRRAAAPPPPPPPHTHPTPPHPTPPHPTTTPPRLTHPPTPTCSDDSKASRWSSTAPVHSTNCCDESSVRVSHHTASTPSSCCSTLLKSLQGREGVGAEQGRAQQSEAEARGLQSARAQRRCRRAAGRAEAACLGGVLPSGKRRGSKDASATRLLRVSQKEPSLASSRARFRSRRGSVSDSDCGSRRQGEGSNAQACELDTSF